MRKKLPKKMSIHMDRQDTVQRLIKQKRVAKNRLRK